MTSVGIIPSRLGSSRLPKKPLIKINEMTMIEHVYKRSMLCKDLDQLYVATCDIEIKKAVESFGGNVIMTSPNHERCTDRIAEAVINIDCDIVVNIQGDEPLVNPKMISNSINELKKDNVLYKTVNNVSKIYNKKEFEDRNNVKVVFNLDKEALYFSREPIPNLIKKNTSSFLGYKQVCIISFAKEYLFLFNKMKQTPLEISESIDMLRCLENNHKIKVVETEYSNWSVDTSDDLKIVEKMMLNDPLKGKY
ncbi:3-deoxy-manno-octulosonate cytidylyltransferase [Alphaproteobacteria bacterium]|jgi:3-deoxy-manno-octulosonate cytidylyltransferase (CMP-KDO synthetase)|nr:3-deoxy-manno-octulosonate cytidylyltransferase [Alphaproteobacteria bacterium]